MSERICRPTANKMKRLLLVPRIHLSTAVVMTLVAGLLLGANLRERRETRPKTVLYPGGLGGWDHFSRPTTYATYGFPLVAYEAERDSILVDGNWLHEIPSYKVVDGMDSETIRKALRWLAQHSCEVSYPAAGWRVKAMIANVLVALAILALSALLCELA